MIDFEMITIESRSSILIASSISMSRKTREYLKTLSGRIYATEFASLHVHVVCDSMVTFSNLKSVIHRFKVIGSFDVGRKRVFFRRISEARVTVNRHIYLFNS